MIVADAAGGPRPGPLLERERELAALRTAIDAVVAGGAQVLLIEGAAGIGKTRLLAETRRLIGEVGMRVLAARGGEMEREFAFGVVRQLFEPALRADGEDALRGAAASARRVFEPAGDDAAGDPSFAVLHGLYWLTVDLSGRRTAGGCGG